MRDRGWKGMPPALPDLDENLPQRLPGFQTRMGLPDPLQDDNLLKTSGRGILMMRTFMDQVDILSSGHGTTVRMIKKLTGIEPTRVVSPLLGFTPYYDTAPAEKSVGVSCSLHKTTPVGSVV